MTPAALVGSLTIGCTFAFSPVAGVLTDHFGIRPTAIGGGFLAAIGMLASSFLCQSVEALYFSYGVLFGVGSSLAYTPSLAVLPLHFNRRLGLANGLVTAGSSVFTVVLPLAMGWLVNNTNLERTLQAMAALVAFIPVCAVCFKYPKKQEDILDDDAPVKTPPLLSGSQAIAKPKKSHIMGINFEIWRRRKYVIWALAIPSALFGYFVPYVHMVKFVNLNFPENDGKVLVMCIGLTSGVGRLVFGKIADMPRVDRIVLQQISFVSIGSLTMLLVATNSFTVLTVLALGMGLFDGCFISLLGPIAFDLCGASGATQAIGFLLGLCSIPLTAGPPIAGAIFDHSGSYTLPFLLAGIPPIVGAGVMFLVRCAKSDEEAQIHHEDSLPVIKIKETNGDISCIKNRRSASIGEPEDDADLEQLSPIIISNS
ncbi:hypothetical protein J437_LFUL002403 [Ladona fulva]|uniref:Monocarboxylate transporter 10 n=1 Tax=Ladona fulva TaxID=123851 RepID=A0A8K0K391_LADFU|nr:hypothetical protein J437_LFUL002403 [Ladona fulva]